MFWVSRWGHKYTSSFVVHEHRYFATQLCLENKSPLVYDAYLCVYFGCPGNICIPDLKTAQKVGRGFFGISFRFLHRCFLGIRKRNSRLASYLMVHMYFEVSRKIRKNKKKYHIYTPIYNIIYHSTLAKGLSGESNLPCTTIFYREPFCLVWP